MVEKDSKYQVLFIRHGESSWNKENRFTGWTDVPLSAQGTSPLLLKLKKKFIIKRY